MSLQLTGDLVVRNQRFAVVSSRFNEFITKRLHEAAIDTLKRHGCSEDNITEIWIPGSFELPLVAQKLAETGKYDAIIALSCLIRGATPHFELIAAEVTKGLTQVMLEHGIPIGFGVLTTNTIEQAIERGGTKSGNKGETAALAALEMVNLVAQIDKKTKH